MNTQKACPKCSETITHKPQCPFFGMEFEDLLQPMTATQAVSGTVPLRPDLSDPEGHSPLPWYVFAGTMINAKKENGEIIIAIAPESSQFAAIHGDMFWETRANAQFITKAANEHYGLLSTVTTLEQSYAALVSKSGELERENAEQLKVITELVEALNLLSYGGKIMQGIGISQPQFSGGIALSKPVLLKARALLTRKESK